MKTTKSYARRGGKQIRPRSSQIPIETTDHRCVLYIRASTLDQKNTLSGQEWEGRKWAERNRLELNGEPFVEPGVTASKPFLKRPVAKEAIAHMKKHGISTLLVLNLNRGFRDVDDMRQTVEFLVDHGFALRIANPDIDARGGYGKFLATVLAAVAELQLAETKDQQRRAFDVMRRNRVALNQNPRYGWNIGDEIPNMKSKSGKPYRRLVPNQEEQATLRRILKAYEEGETLEAIANWLNNEGIKTKNAGKQFTRKGKTYTASGIWKPQTVSSVIAYAELDDEPT